MSDAILLLVYYFAFALVAGALGGMVTAGLVLWARVKWPRVLLGGLATSYALDVDVQLRTKPVLLNVNVQRPDPVIIEVATGGAPAMRELAARVIATMPSIGPTDLHNIVGCSKSTAHAILTDVRAGRLLLPDVEEAEEEE